MTLDILLIVCLFVVNGMLAMAEIAIVTARRARLQSIAEKGHKGAAAAIAPSLSFVPNRGQADSPVRYEARAGDVG